MLWHTSITPRWLTPRGEVATTCAGRSGFLAGSEKNHHLGRWHG
ncbi:hypothetical protein [Polymorphospora lycopeni]|uniref:Uncharacterized protein n=1 Tax=Polymorphospora lycopeni TaxID=3140240 RepID=A0ABV5CPF5_9ACTN